MSCFNAVAVTFFGQFICYGVTHTWDAGNLSSIGKSLAKIHPCGTFRELELSLEAKRDLEFELSRYPTVDYLLVIAPPPMCYYIAAYLKPRFEGKIEVKSSPWIGEPQVLQALDAKFYELLRQANRKAIARKP